MLERIPGGRVFLLFNGSFGVTVDPAFRSNAVPVERPRHVARTTDTPVSVSEFPFDVEDVGAAVVPDDADGCWPSRRMFRQGGGDDLPRGTQENCPLDRSTSQDIFENQSIMRGTFCFGANPRNVPSTVSHPQVPASLYRL